MTELISNMPIEIVLKFFEHLDVKSAVLFASGCKSLHSSLKGHIHDKEKQAVLKMMQNAISMLKKFYDDLTSCTAHCGMLSFLLRRLIHTSAVYHTINEAELNFALFTKYNEEYSNVFLQMSEEIEMDAREFNTYMENAQFEYRGFNIIGIPIGQRERLDAFKDVIETRYFNETFRLQTYVAYSKNAFIEIIFDGEIVEYDFHVRRDDDGAWVFIDQEMNRAEIALQHANEVNRMIRFHHTNDDAIEEIVDLMFELFGPYVKGNIAKGAEQTNMSIWNSMYDDNVVFAEAVNCYMSDYNIEQRLHTIFNSP
jgi:hypothetical protein